MEEYNRTTNDSFKQAADLLDKASSVIKDGYESQGKLYDDKNNGYVPDNTLDDNSKNTNTSNESQSRNFPARTETSETKRAADEYTAIVNNRENGTAVVARDGFRTELDTTTKISQSGPTNARVNKIVPKAAIGGPPESINPNELAFAKAWQEAEKTKEELDEIHRANGTYNTGHLDMTGVANSAIETVKSQYSNAQAVQGYKEMGHIASLMGVGSVFLSSSVKADASTFNASILNRSQSDMEDMRNIFGGKYRTGEVRTGNWINDYNNNVKLVNNKLREYGINAKDLSNAEIKRALKRGELKNRFSNNGVKISEKDTKLRFLLEEKKRLNDQKMNVTHYQKHGGGSTMHCAGNLGKTVMNEASSGTAVASGYNVYKTSKTVIKAGAKFGVVGVKSGINMGSSVIATVRRGAVDVQRLGNKYRLSKASDPKMKARYQARAEELKNRRYSITQNNRNFKSNVRSFNPIGKLKNNITSNISGWWNNLAINRFRFMIKNKLQNTLIGKVFGQINIIQKTIQNFIKKIIIGAALSAIAWIMIVAVIMMIPIIIKMGSGTSVEAEENAATTNAQVTINYLYDYQSSYATNIYNCNSTNKTASGSQMIKYRLPSSWFSKLERYDSKIQKNEAAVFYQGSIAGFDMSKYWGQPSDKNDTSLGYDSLVMCEPDSISQSIYKDMITVFSQQPCEHPVYDDEGNILGYDKYLNIDYCGYAGFEGYGGTITEDMDGYSCGDTLRYNYMSGTNGYTVESDQGTALLNRWKNKKNEEVTVKYYYRGSEYSCHLTDLQQCMDLFNHDEHDTETDYEVTGSYHKERSATYWNTEGEEVTYDVKEFYKTILTLAAAMSDNNDSDNISGEEDADEDDADTEEQQFFKDYCKNVFDQIMDDAEVVLTYNYEPDADAENVSWTIVDTASGASFECADRAMKCVVNINIYINNCGIADAMNEDSKVLYGEDGDSWMHVQADIGKFHIKDTESAEYTMWYTVYNSEDFLPAWGLTRNERKEALSKKGGTGEDADYYVCNSVLEYFPNAKCYQVHSYSYCMSNAVEYNNLRVEDWEESIEGLIFPTEISIADFTSKQVMANINLMDGLFDTSVDWENIDWSTYTTGDANLDAFLQYATTQMWIQQQAGQQGLCYYTSLMMLAMYYNPERADEIMANIVANVDNVCTSEEHDGTVTWEGITWWNQEYGISVTGDNQYSSKNEMYTGVTDQINSGNPVVIHIYGDWTSTDGTEVYHSGESPHFLVVYSYTPTGVYVADPAGTATGKLISWDALYSQIGENGDGYGYRTVSK